MLSAEDNELLCRVGPGTPMGALMRQYWIPAARSNELPEPGGPQRRIKLLGEELIGFRLASGAPALVANACPHRGASLFLGRNEGDGLRCVYHGWKFDGAGRCIDMPSEPRGSAFQGKVRALTYPCVERGGVIWAYLGSRAEPPPLPDFEANTDPKAGVWSMIRDCNWLQALEGDIDTVHFAFLHMGHLRPEDAASENFLYYQLRERAPRYSVADVPFGTSYGAWRPAREDGDYWRIAHFLFPFWTMVPVGALLVNRWARAWVPMDDTHTMFFMLMAPPAGGHAVFPEATRSAAYPLGPPIEYLPDTSDWFGRARPRHGPANDWGLDREKARKGESFTGLPNVVMEDQAVTESMGPIYDRTQEHLGTSDEMVIRTRRRLLRAALALRDGGLTPPGVDEPALYRQRSGGVILPRGADWQEATAELRKAYVEHSDEAVQRSIGAR